MDPAPARLVVRFGPYPKREYQLPEHTTTIGREPINDVAILDPEISRRHARITYQQGNYFVEDLVSTNGTFVNGQQIREPVQLQHGDIIDFGESISFVFHSTAETLPKTVVQGEPLEPEVATMARPPQASAPTAAPAAPPATAMPSRQEPPVTAVSSEAPRDGTNYVRLLLGCGCLLLLSAFLCVATLFLLDAVAPDLLYCGPFQFVLEAAGFVMDCP